MKLNLKLTCTYSIDHLTCFQHYKLMIASKLHDKGFMSFECFWLMLVKYDVVDLKVFEDKDNV